jgi:hypothetical protein
MKAPSLGFVVAALVLSIGACAPADPSIALPGSRGGDEAFLDTLQHRTFQFFWETTNPRNGLVPDRWPTPSFSSVAAVGFGLTAYPVGIERGWITREQGIERVLTTLRFLWNAPQGPEPTGVSGYRGFFYHFLDMETGHRYGTVELSTIDTMLLLAGALFCREYFERADPREAEIRALADSLYLRVEWSWVDPQAPLIGMGWHPESGFIPHSYRGYDEAMLLYLLALGSPTHPVGPESWEAYTSSHPWADFYGQQHVNFAPLFGHQYSHVWVDFRGIRDAYMRGRGIDYFENSRRATLAQREYAMDNPMRWRGYGADVWGLTASDGPKDTVLVLNGEQRQFWSYRARGAAATRVEDDGTLVPTAAGGSIPFAPEITIRALRTMREQYGEHLWGEYGFFDAFNPTFQWTDVPLTHGRVVPGVGWFDTDYLGIDQGPILLMAENHRTELVWRYMRRNPYLVSGLRRAGFTGGWIDGRCN